MRTKIYCTASIQERAEPARTDLHLTLDQDDRFHWYTVAGRDTEVSGSTLGAAISHAHMIWRDQDFRIPRIAEIE